jgi:8-oxo-dGTP pyrophosphatase MutT (NUDIX family)
MNKTQYADVVLTNAQGQVLLLHRCYGDSFMAGKMCLPGGHVDDEEDPMNAAQREVFEETGLIVAVSLICVKEKEDCIIHYYQGSVEKDVFSPQIILDNTEHRGYEWTNKEDVSKKDLVCDLSSYIDNLLPLTPIEDTLKLRELTPEETVDSSFQTISTAFDNGFITEIDFLKARELFLIAKSKQAIDTIVKAFDLDLISEEQYFDALKKAGDPSHGGKLIKKLITNKKGNTVTKWVDKETGEELVKEKKKK